MVCFPIRVNFGGSFNGKYWYVLRPFVPFYCYHKYVMAIWYNLWSFGTFFPFWYFVPRKIWQPCPRPPEGGHKHEKEKEENPTFTSTQYFGGEEGVNVK
jgi:hypothetical protein